MKKIIISILVGICTVVFFSCEDNSNSVQDNKRAQKVKETKACCGDDIEIIVPLPPDDKEDDSGK